MSGDRGIYGCQFAVTVFTLVFAWSSFGLSCEFQSVESTYEQSLNVFLAQIVSAELIDHDSEAREINQNRVRHRFKVIESFKGEVDYDSFETGFAWPDNVAHFAVGDVNLFFMGEVPGFGSCSPRYLLGQQDTADVLQKLRDHKKGLIESISGAWTTNISADRCSIHTTYLLSKSSSSLSLSIGRTKSGSPAPVGSTLWVYSYSKDTSDVIDDSGLLVSLASKNIAIPYSSGSLENGANFFTRVDRIDRLLNAILARESVVIEGTTRSNDNVEIPIFLNGGSTAIKEFALCSNLGIGDE